MALLADHNSDRGFEIKIEKGIKAGSGIGSSSASAAGAVVGINHLLEPYTRNELISFAMEGERVACGTAHADNVSPVLEWIYPCSGLNPLDVITLNSHWNWLSRSSIQKLKLKHLMRVLFYSTNHISNKQWHKQQTWVR